MGAGHAHALYIHEHSPVHRLAPEVKLVAALAVVASVALTPREAVWAFAVHATVVGAIVVLSRVPVSFVATRLVAVFPFILFAVFIPFVASGERIEVLGVAMSREGLWASWNIFAKATLGATVSITLAATTEVPEMLRGLGILRVPSLITAIAGFMMRYLELISGELSRMRRAMTARGYDPRWLWQARPIATSAGAMFIRSYERGERVHAAMLARGYDGTMPELNPRRATPAEWVRGAVPAAVAVAVLVVAVVMT